jgi:ribose 5-phosphate isomerase B
MTDLNRIGIAADHAGFELKKHLLNKLISAGFDVKDFGDKSERPRDDYPDYVIPLATAIAAGEVSRGLAICGSGVGACIAGNKIPGARACLVNEKFSAKQGVEDDDMNLLCLGARVINAELAWELAEIFLSARFSNAERHVRRLNKIKAIENNLHKNL